MIEAIIFDKDGTLLDFDPFWVSVSVHAINDTLKAVGREDIPVKECLAAIGVKDGISDIDAVLCKGTYEEIGEAVHGVLRAHGCETPVAETVRLVIDGYNRNADKGEVLPTCENLKEVLTSLKAQGKKLLVITTDNEVITKSSLARLGVAELFDRICTDDGKTPVKPDPACVFKFCEDTGIPKEHVIMVGDTMTDIRFAKNAGIRSVGVGAKAENRALLAPHADFTVPDVSHIFEILERMESND